MSMRGRQLLEKFDEVFLMTLGVARNAFNEVGRDVGMTGPQMNVLMALQRFESGVTMKELSEMQMLSHGATTGLVDRMINMDLLERTRSETDRRVVYVCLSKKGRSVFKRITERRAESLTPILDQLDESAEESVLKALTILEDQFKRLI
jgi:MarR family transcriptional regulator, organic hydroperoxide resistance regulator